jgi:hypothetical protein
MNPVTGPKKKEKEGLLRYCPIALGQTDELGGIRGLIDVSWKPGDRIIAIVEPAQCRGQGRPSPSQALELSLGPTNQDAQWH